MWESRDMKEGVEKKELIVVPGANEDRRREDGTSRGRLSPARRVAILGAFAVGEDEVPPEVDFEDGLGEHPGGALLDVLLLVGDDCGEGGRSAECEERLGAAERTNEHCEKAEGQRALEACEGSTRHLLGSDSDDEVIPPERPKPVDSLQTRHDGHLHRANFISFCTHPAITHTTTHLVVQEDDIVQLGIIVAPRVDANP